MKKACVISPRCTQESAKWLAEALEIPYHNPYGERREDFTDYKTVINYGVSSNLYVNKVLNAPSSIRISVDKLKTHEVTKETVSTMEYTQSKETARSWINQGYWVVCRETAVGKRSEGTTIVSTLEDLEAAPALYWTMYVPHLKELRVNVFRDTVLTVLEKVECPIEHVFDFKQIKGFKHPWLPATVKELYQKVGLDFAGIDFLVTQANELVFLEINSGPALFGATADKLYDKLYKEINNA